MLVFERNLYEKVCITVPPSDKPTHIVCSIERVIFKRGIGNVRVGWDAPRCVEIHREEVQERIDVEGKMR